jgi:hypothetical protein
MTVENHKGTNIKTDVKGRNDGGLSIFLEWDAVLLNSFRLKSI